MARTVAQLRNEARFWLNDPRGTNWDDARVDTLLGIAYPLVVAVVETSGKHWNVSRTRILLAIDGTEREYVFDDENLVRRPISFYRVDGVTAVDQVTPAAGRTRLTHRSLNDMQVAAPYPGTYGLERFAGTEFVYLFRSSAMEWVLGFEAAVPRDQVIEITYVPTTEDWTNEDHVPKMVPPDFHHLIAMRAAMLAKSTENRINPNTENEYARAERIMLDELSSLRAHGSQRF